MEAYRYDIGEMKKPRKLSNGSMIFDGTLTRSGVFIYLNPDGSERKEYRPPEEVFKEDSMYTFEHAPVTDDHPTEMVTSENARLLTVGVTNNIRKNDDHIIASMLIFDKETINKIEAGKQELSCGYIADILNEPGVTPNGEKYDAIQRNIRGNHVAIVDVGRAGTAKLRVDSAQMKRDEIKDNNNMELNEALQKIAGLEFDKLKETSRADALESELREVKALKDKLQAEKDAACERADVAEQNIQRTDETMQCRVDARVNLCVSASKILDSSFESFAGKSDRDLKLEVIKTVTGFECNESHSEDYVNARYDAALERAGEANKSTENVKKATEATRGDVEVDEEEAARARMIEHNANLWKGAN